MSEGTPIYKKHLTKEQALQKVKHYCGYQERCHLEVQQKLWELGVTKSFHDEIIAVLIEGNYLNEERFAKQFAGGKFRMKGWGRKKITQALKEKGISTYLLKLAMKEIKEDVYNEKLRLLVKKKYAALKGEQYLVRKKKTFDFALQRGYEPPLILQCLESLKKD